MFPVAFLKKTGLQKGFQIITEGVRNVIAHVAFGGRRVGGLAYWNK